MYFEQIFTLFLAIYAVQGQQHQIGYREGGSKYLPGVQLRLTRKFFDLVTAVGSNVINEVLSGSKKVTFPVMEKKIPGGAVKLRDIKIEHYKNNKPYILETVAPYSIKIGVQDADVTVTSKYDFLLGTGLILPVRNVGSGKAKVTAKGLKVITTSLLDKTEDGVLKLEVTDCKTSFRDFQLEINPSAGQTIPVFGSTAGIQLISAAAKPIFESDMCEQVRNMIDGSLNKQLLTLGGKIKLSKIQGILENEDDKGSSKDPQTMEEDFKRVLLESMKDMELDLRLKERPLLLSAKPYDFVESKHQGEISYKGMGGTPFYPHLLSPIIHLDRMFIASISDYVLNSMLHSIYNRRKAGLISTVLNKTTVPSQSNLLQTTCRKEFCLGDFFSDIAQKHPNKEVEIVFEPKDEPFMIFHTGLIKGSLSELITVRVNSPGWANHKTVLTGSVSVNPEAKLYVQNDKIYGDVTLRDFKMPLSGDPTEAKDFQDLIYQLLQGELNDKLKAGINLPKIHTATLRNIQMDVIWRTLKIKSDVKIDKEMLTEMVEGVVHKLQGNSGAAGLVNWRRPSTNASSRRFFFF